jgi:hypothetical protein
MSSGDLNKAVVVAAVPVRDLRILHMRTLIMMRITHYGKEGEHLESMKAGKTRRHFGRTSFKREMSEKFILN